MILYLIITDNIKIEGFEKEETSVHRDESGIRIGAEIEAKW